MRGWKAFIRDNPVSRGPDLHLAKVLDESWGGVTEILMPPERGAWALKRIANDGTYHAPEDPFLHGDMANGIIQAIMDAAWAHGYRPTGISGERGEIRRIEEHLADMRAIVFKTGKP